MCKAAVHDELIQLKSNQTKAIRDEILELQDGRCAICDDPITDKTGVTLDHQHKTSKETNGEDGAGLVRGVLCSSCNLVEGKIWNNMKRFKQTNTVDERIKFLKAVISYYEEGTYNLIHSTEKEKEPNLSKRNYNKLKKLYLSEGKQKKFPDYPKSGKLTKELSKLFTYFDVSPYN